MEAASNPETATLTKRSIRPVFQGLLIGLACGAMVWAVMLAVHPPFAVPERYHIAGIGAPVEQHLAFRYQQDIVDRRHIMVYLGALGFILGAALGGWFDRSWRVAGLGAMKAMTGALLAALLASLFYVAMRNRVWQGDLLLPFVRQLIIGVPTGAWLGQGLMLTRGWAGIRRGLLVGAVGGVIFSVAYTLIVALFLPAANTESLLPEEALTRLVWLTMLGGSIGLMAGFAMTARLPKSQSVAASPP